MLGKVNQHACWAHSLIMLRCTGSGQMPDHTGQHVPCRCTLCCCLNRQPQRPADSSSPIACQSLASSTGADLPIQIMSDRATTQMYQGSVCYRCFPFPEPLKLILPYVVDESLTCSMTVTQESTAALQHLGWQQACTCPCLQMPSASVQASARMPTNICSAWSLMQSA